MGMSLSYLWYLSEKGHLPPKARLLDIGASYLYNVTPADVVRFAQKHGSRSVPQSTAEDIAERSNLIPGRQMLFLSELLDHTDIDYVSYDVCPGVKTTVFDLNRQNLPDAVKGTFDVVLNFGTTEHVINQLNTFKIIHEALKVNGVAFHQSPSIGYVNHGYFCYHQRFYDDLQIANSYEELDKWYTKATLCGPPELDFRDAEKPLQVGSGAKSEIPVDIPCCNLNVLHRKTSGGAFRVSLELSTSHSGLAQEVSAIHLEDPVVHQTRAVDLLASLLKRGAARLGLRF